MTRKVAIQISVLTALVPILIVAAGVTLAETAVHPSAPAKDSPPATNSHYEDIAIQPPHGPALHAWLFLPARPHPNYVIVLHGVADNRAGMGRYIRMLLKHDFAVLAPTSRTDLATYGVREAPDVHLWADYLFRTQPIQRLYGLGESMGAAVLLQSLPLEPRFRAVVAECPFSTFDAIAHDRVAQLFESDSWPVRAIAAPMVFSGLLYTRLRYGVDLTEASPLNAVRHSTTPILLVHGLRDTNISPQHSRILLLANPQRIVPWFVPKAGHVGAFSAQPAVFEERVTTFLEAHQD